MITNIVFEIPKKWGITKKDLIKKYNSEFSLSDLLDEVNNLAGELEQTLYLRAAGEADDYMVFNDRARFLNALAKLKSYFK